jgi:hypothetical protein
MQGILMKLRRQLIIEAWFQDMPVGCTSTIDHFSAIKRFEEQRTRRCLSDAIAEVMGVLEGKIISQKL